MTTSTVPRTSEFQFAIQPSLLVKAEISPLQYGQFIEYLADVVPGMWAEKLSDCSFEGIGQWMWNFIKETDGVDRPWYPAGQVNRATFRPRSNGTSQRFGVTAHPHHWGVAVHGGNSSGRNRILCR